ncbi:hypothetical protein KIPB_001801 [Kipferlia bialata]|uniref:Uncharacterized protein n=1 Tax=Kipferlia bialata TaxID=797122 RepID=A0A9K3GG73_9EUKA|nr:hypothetical protein KIPB_001801 [Kipferlia bialata]|eukprot:g1801.t1
MDFSQPVALSTAKGGSKSLQRTQRLPVGAGKHVSDSHHVSSSQSRTYGSLTRSGYYNTTPSVVTSGPVSLTASSLNAGSAKASYIVNKAHFAHAAAGFSPTQPVTSAGGPSGSVAPVERVQKTAAVPQMGPAARAPAITARVTAPSQDSGRLSVTSLSRTAPVTIHSPYSNQGREVSRANGPGAASRERSRQMSQTQRIARKSESMSRQQGERLVATQNTEKVSFDSSSHGSTTIRGPGRQRERVERVSNAAPSETSKARVSVERERQGEDMYLSRAPPAIHRVAGTKAYSGISEALQSARRAQRAATELATRAHLGETDDRSRRRYVHSPSVVPPKEAARDKRESTVERGGSVDQYAQYPHERSRVRASSHREPVAVDTTPVPSPDQGRERERDSMQGDRYYSQGGMSREVSVSAGDGGVFTLSVAEPVHKERGSVSGPLPAAPLVAPGGGTSPRRERERERERDSAVPAVETVEREESVQKECASPPRDEGEGEGEKGMHREPSVPTVLPPPSPAMLQMSIDRATRISESAYKVVPSTVQRIRSPEPVRKTDRPSRHARPSRTVSIGEAMEMAASRTPSIRAPKTEGRGSRGSRVSGDADMAAVTLLQERERAEEERRQRESAPTVVVDTSVSVRDREREEREREEVLNRSPSRTNPEHAGKGHSSAERERRGTPPVKVLDVTVREMSRQGSEVGMAVTESLDGVEGASLSVRDPASVGFRCTVAKPTSALLQWRGQLSREGEWEVSRDSGDGFEPVYASSTPMFLDLGLEPERLYRYVLKEVDISTNEECLVAQVSVITEADPSRTGQ